MPIRHRQPSSIGHHPLRRFQTPRRPARTMGLPTAGNPSSITKKLRSLRTKSLNLPP